MARIEGAQIESQTRAGKGFSLILQLGFMAFSVWAIEAHAQERIFTNINAGLPGVDESAVAWADYDGDGDPDILLTGNTGSTRISRIYKNNRNGTFTDINAGLVGVDFGAVAWADYDGDGDPDILLTGQTGVGPGIAKIYRNDGGDVFTDINANLNGVDSGAVAWGDYDSDGDPDILLMGEPGGSYISKVYRNDGSSVFTDINAGLDGVGSESSGGWADYDLDGDLDILLSGDQGDGSHYITKIYRNNAGESFTNVSASLVGVYATSVAWGDYDGDSDPDIIVTGFTGSIPVSKIYCNNGNGTFSDINAGLLQLYGGSVAWGDYDLDGDLDALLTGYDNMAVGRSKIYRNDGNNAFAAIEAGLAGVHGSSVAWMDYDLDGDLDILLTGSPSTSVIYRNDPGAVPTYALSGTITVGSNPLSGVTVDGGAVGSIFTDSNGQYIFSALTFGTSYVVTPTKLGYSFNPISASGTIADNTVHNFSATITPPAIPTITNPHGGLRYASERLSFAGTAEAGTDVTVYVDDEAVGTATVTTAGYWGLTMTTSLTNGIYSVRAKSTNALGQDSTMTAAITVLIDLSALPPMVQVSTGATHTCARTTAGAVKCWGGNANGQLGNGSTGNTNTPVDVVGLPGQTDMVQEIVTGYMHTCALLETGAVLCWGANSWGQLGDGTNVGKNVPTTVSGFNGEVLALSAGGYHTCALVAGQGVKCWGQNVYGQLGNGTEVDSTVPVSVVGLGTDISRLKSGESHNCVLLNSGGIKCWGANHSGRLGDGTWINRNTPINVTGLSSGVADILVGGSHTCAVMSGTRSVKCWGYNFLGQLGDGSTTDRLTPVNVQGLGGPVVSLAGGHDATCALLEGNSMKCWGRNYRGQVGDATLEDRPLPVQVTGMTASVSAIASSYEHTCAINDLGRVKCWGRNGEGQLGDMSATHRYTAVDPAVVPGAPAITSPVNGTITNVARPVISGTSPAATSVKLYKNGSLIGTVTPNESGTWSYTPGADWEDGLYQLTAQAVDAAMKSSQLSGIVTITVDTAVPEAPVISSPVNGTVTNVRRPVLSGTSQGASTVQILRNGTLLATVTPSEAGAWSYTPSADWSDGTYQLTAQAVDAAMNSSPLSAIVTLTVDTAAPEAPVILLPVSSTVISVFPVTVSGTAESGNVVKVYEGGVLLGTATPNSSGQWTFVTESGFASGEHQLMVTATDSAGNVSVAAQASFVVRIDSDNDGIDDETEEESGLDPTSDDSDGDGVSDGTEIEDGSDPLDKGSSVPKLSRTVCAEWNGFLGGMWNVLEHINLSSGKLQAICRFYDLSGHIQAFLKFSVKAKGQVDLIVHKMKGFESNSYGKVCTTLTGGNPGDLDGRMVYYKENGHGRYQFAFALPFLAGLKGRQYVLCQRQRENAPNLTI